jgi:hypothetical protein
MLVYYIYPIIGLFFLVVGLPIFGDKASNHSIPTMVICGIILVFLPIYMRIHLKNCYKRTRSDNGECKLIINEEYIEVEGQYTKGEMDWKAVKTFLENKKIFMLYLAPAKFIVIPKRVCTEAQIGELRMLLLRQVKPATN